MILMEMVVIQLELVLRYGWLKTLNVLIIVMVCLYLFLKILLPGMVLQPEVMAIIKMIPAIHPLMVCIIIGMQVPT